MTRLNVGICGASGRMGQMLVTTVLGDAHCTLAAALDIAGSPHLGKDAGAHLGKTTGVLIADDIAAAVARCDVLIDFTRPAGTLVHLAACVAAKKQLIIGTTGFDAVGKAAIADAAKHIGVVFAPNMSIGVNVTYKLLEVAAKALTVGYDVEIVETHHRLKVDAPSGTALGMGEVVAQAMGRAHDGVAEYARHGHTGVRRDDAIGYAVIRGGDIVGDHTVMFIGQGERIEVSHKATSRDGYATGALRACHFLRGKASGLFDMQDVLGLRG